MPKVLRNFIGDHRKLKRAIQFRLRPEKMFRMRRGDHSQRSGPTFLYPFPSFHSLSPTARDFTPLRFEALSQYCTGSPSAKHVNLSSAVPKSFLRLLTMPNN